MKKVILLIMCFVILGYSESCTLQNLDTTDGIEDAQKCMLGQLEELDKIMGRYENYHVSYKETFEKLIKQEGTCQKWKLLYDRTKDDDYKVSVSDCEALYHERLVMYTKISKQYNRISIHYNKLKENKEALALKENMLKSAADLFGIKR